MRPFLNGLVTGDAWKGWLRAGVALLAVIVVFGVYYHVIVGGASTPLMRQDSSLQQLKDLSLKTADYFVPHPRSALLKGDFKATYWDVQPRPEKNADSDVAYLGFITFLLALYGVWKGRGPARWFFLTGAAVAFWSTLGPSFSGLPTPSRLIYLYAPFARRILLYKTFVQFGMAGLAGMGAAFVLSRMKSGLKIPAIAGISALMLAEFAIVPPFLSVDLTVAPPVYERVKALPEKAAIIEIPMKRSGGNLYQGYVFYQSIHHKPLFNPYADMALSRVPERIQHFYHQMETPLEAGRYENLAALRFLGVTHLIYHPYIGTTTVQFLSFAAPDLESGGVPGLNRIYECPKQMEGSYRSPYDYTFGDLHEITAEPCPAALVFSAGSPFVKPASWTGEDGMLPFGLYSAVAGTDSAFVCPLWNNGRVERILRKPGCITVVNLSDKAADFDLSFTVHAESTRIIELSQDGTPLAKVTAGPDPSTYTATGFTLPASGTARIMVGADGAPYDYLLPIGKQNLPIRALATFSDFRVAVK